MIFKHYGRSCFVLHGEKRRLDSSSEKRRAQKGRIVSIMTKKFRKAISNASLTTSIAKQDVLFFPPQAMALKKVVTTAAANISKTKLALLHFHFSFFFF